MSKVRARKVAWASLASASFMVGGCPESRHEPVRTAVQVVPEPGAAAARKSSAGGARQVAAAAPDDTKAHARVIDHEGKTVGRVTFSTRPTGVLVRFEGEGLPPGRRGMHIHEHGVCNPADEFESAGAHWSPDHRQHGLASPEGPHAGDMPNLEVDEDGRADFSYILPRATLEPEGTHSLLSGNATSIVIHARRDDQRTDPTGESGARIACGVIEPVR